MNFQEIRVVSGELKASYPAAFTSIGAGLIGVMWDGEALVVMVDSDPAAIEPALPNSFRSLPLRVEKTERPVEL